MDISFEHYRIFYYVAKYGSFTQAANVLLNSQPNITRVIKHLEQELGCPLFIRMNRRIALTPEGQHLYEHVAAAYSHLKAGEEALMREKTLESGTIFISASEVALHTLLLPILQEFRSRYPGVHIRISNDTTPQAVQHLKNGTADLAVVTTPTGIDAMLDETELLTIQETAICSNAYCDVANRTLTLRELTQYPLISLGQNTSTYRFYASYFAKHGLELQPDIEAATADQILPMVKADLGIGFVPEAFLREEPERGPVYRLTLSEPLPPRAVCLLKRKDQMLTLAGQALEKMLLERKRLYQS